MELNINDSANVAKYGLEASPNIRKIFMDYLLNYLLLPYESANVKPPVSTTQQPQSQEQLQNAQTNSIVNEPIVTTAAASEIPACMSEKLYKQFKNDVNLLDGDELEQVSLFVEVRV